MVGRLDDAARIGVAWRELRRGAAANAFRQRTLVADGLQLELGQVDALEILNAQGVPMTMSAFAEAMRIDRSTATRAVDRLESLGYATRATGSSDSRVKLVTITDHGRAVVQDVVDRRFAALVAVFDEFDDAELRQLADLLDRLVSSMDRPVDSV